MEINSQTRPIGLLGHPVGHSLSPKLHNAIYKNYGINCIYLAFDIKNEELQNAINGFKALSFIGFNVTIPHKQSVLQYIDELEKEAFVTGAVNTVKIDNERLIGYNTDGIGFISSLKSRGFDFRGMDVLVLGAGGSARSICVSLAKEGVSSLNIFNRTKSNAKALAQHLMKHFASFNMNVVERQILNAINYDLIINTTSVGMLPLTEDSPLDEYNFNSEQIVVDIIYNPQQTKMLKDAANAGCVIFNGLDMLAGQAVKAIDIWTGTMVDHNFALNVLS